MTSTGMLWTVAGVIALALVLWVIASDWRRRRRADRQLARIADREDLTQVELVCKAIIDALEAGEDPRDVMAAVQITIRDWHQLAPREAR